MIDLATFKKRSEFIEAYESVEKERDYWREFCHDLELRLQQYEGVQPTNEDAEKEFQKFWALYGRKGNNRKTRRRWFNLSKAKKALAMDKVADYVKSTPDKQYRMGGDTWLLNEGWNDECAFKNGRPDIARSAAYKIATNEDKQLEQMNLAKAANQRQANRGQSVKDRLKIK